MADLVFLESVPSNDTRNGVSFARLNLPADADSSNGQYGLTAFDRARLEQTRALYVTSQTLARESAHFAAYQAIDIAKAAGAVVAYAPHSNAAQWQNKSDAVRFSRSLIITADILSASYQQLPLLTGETEPEKAADVLTDQGVRIILLPLDDGSMFVRVGYESGSIKNTFDHDAATEDASETILIQFLRRFLVSGKTLKEVTHEDAITFVGASRVNDPV